MSGYANATQLCERGIRAAHLVDCCLKRRDPIGRVLLGPAGMWMDGFIVTLGRADGCSIAVNKQRAQAGGSKINAEKGHLCALQVGIQRGFHAAAVHKVQPAGKSVSKVRIIGEVTVEFPLLQPGGW